MKDYLLLTLVLAIMVFGQIMTKIGSMQGSLFNIFVLLGYSALIVRGVLWILALRANPISLAYPFLSLSFVFILGVSSYLFDEPVTHGKLVGSVLITVGVMVISKSKVKADD